MKEKIKLVQKNSKQYRWLLRIILVLLGAWILYSSTRGIFYSMQESNAFAVKETTDDVTGYPDKVLTINGKEEPIIDIDMYSGPYHTSKETGLPNYKFSVLIDILTNTLKVVFIFIIIIIVYKMNEEIIKDISPFSKKNVKRLRVISILVLAFIFVPIYTEFILTLLVFLKSAVQFTIMDFLLIFLSFAIYGISYIIEYACALQKEVDETI
ncbi:DUF2975 domain-containing protein [Anaerosacchariphilus polymeriproducens]|uniref:DUF2975 domain-containing protein n=1 Tax=Anaerosacchariphilus polymeriproducens TaxID=1812858 RepID=A0A371AR24_9FIRM|nr:DUF2975 domain-containing protein [Anaerosacchariphilus polymeriproducens]RDU22036.1 DUF2975 domain-containing protein [Anaerosacchariphilus polymeriproducens]